MSGGGLNDNSFSKDRGILVCGSQVLEFLFIGLDVKYFLYIADEVRQLHQHFDSLLLILDIISNGGG